MSRAPISISLDKIAEVIADKFRGEQQITCYVGSNTATPTASLEVLTEAIKNGGLRLPFIRMVHILLQGPVPYVAEGLQDKVMTYSIFSLENVRKAANEGRAYYLPCTLANLERMIGAGREFEPDVVFIKVTRNEKTGEFSLGLFVEALYSALANADMVIAELDPSMPFTQGQSVIDPSAIDYLVCDEGIKPVYDFPAPDYANLSPQEQRIGELITGRFLQDGATIQVGIGKIPDAVIATIRDSGCKDLGIQTELYGDGLMLLQKAGIVNNRRKKVDTGYSTTSMIAGSKELYDFVHMRTSVQMRACTYTNAAEVIRKNAPFLSVNTAIGVDLFGNVWADFIDARRYYSGVGGQPDFIRALGDHAYGVPIIAFNSVTDKGESKISITHPSGVSLTATWYDGVVIATEYGIADLRDLTVGEKALAIAAVAHPKFREQFIRHVVDDPFFTKPRELSTRSVPRGVIPYKGNVTING